MRYLFTLCIAGLAALSLASCNKGGSNTMADATMRADSIKKANIDGYMKVNDMMSSGKMDDLGKYIADNYVEHQMMPGQKPGLAGLKEMMTNMKTSMPDMKFTVNHITADTNMIWAEATMTGTNSGPWMGMPPTGKKINVEAVDIIKLGPDGKATEHWGFMEEHKMMQQLGLAPADAAPGDMKDMKDMKGDGGKMKM